MDTLYSGKGHNNNRDTVQKILCHPQQAYSTEVPVIGWAGAKVGHHNRGETEWMYKHDIHKGNVPLFFISLLFHLYGSRLLMKKCTVLLMLTCVR